MQSAILAIMNLAPSFPFFPDTKCHYALCINEAYGTAVTQEGFLAEVRELEVLCKTENVFTLVPLSYWSWHVSLQAGTLPLYQMGMNVSSQRNSSAWVSNVLRVWVPKRTATIAIHVEIPWHMAIGDAVCYQSLSLDYFKKPSIKNASASM